jgi:adenosylmethionine-8-amino-7-oxononanoate aminotransferase
MTLGKGLTGGSLPMSAVLATDAVYDAFRSAPGRDRTFYHSHTFGGNPIAAAAALAALDVYEQESVVESCRPRIAQLAAGIGDVAAAVGGAPCGSLGMMAVVELDDALGGAPRVRRITARAMELGLFVRPLGRCIYLWPPLTTAEAELAEMLAILQSAARQTPS